MRGRSILLPALALFGLVGPAAALELRWASGASDLHTVGAIRCTLLVRCTGAQEALPTEFRLLYTGESEGAESVNVVADQPSAGLAAACALPTMSAEDQISRTQVAEFCGLAGEPRPRALRFLVDIPTGLQARLKLVPISCQEGTCASNSGESLEVSVNGGANRPYPPLLLRAVGRQAGGVLTTSIDGVGLSSVEAVRLVAAGTDAPIPLQILTKSDTVLVAEATLADPFSTGRVEVGDGAGAVAAIAFQIASSANPPPDLAGEYFLVRFRPGEVRRPGGRDAGSVSEFSFTTSDLRDRLQAAGVSALQPVFPWFKPTDVHSQNLIGEPVELEDLSDFYFASVAAGAEVAAAVGSLRAFDGVHWVGADYGGRAAQVVPNDPLFFANKQWSLRNNGQTLCGQTATFNVDINPETAWDLTTGLPSVRVGVLDTGIDTTHTELSSHVRAGPAFVNPPVTTSYDDDLFGRHGTAMAGIIAATGNNDTAMAGVAWRVTPWAIKVLRGNGESRASWVSQGISWATANGIPILCMGIGFPEVPCAGFTSILPESAQIMNTACLNALYAGQLPIASMGNCNSQTKFWPAAFANRVYAVGAEYFRGVRWEDCNVAPNYCGTPCPNSLCPSGSSFGPWIDAVAPGGRLIVTLAGGPNGINDIGPTCNPNNGFVNMAFGGTSASAGIATGIAALLMSQEPNLLGEDIANLLNISAVHPGDPRDNFVGYGLIQAAAATGRLASPFRLFHHTIGPENTVGTLSDVDSIQVTQRFSNVPTLWGNVSYTAWRHRMRGVARFNDGYGSDGLPPRLWTRSSGTWGWRDTTKAAAMDTIIDYNDDVRWGRLVGDVVPPGWTGGVQTDTFETFVYRVIKPGVPDSGRWFPCPPESARVAFSTNGRFSAVGVEDRFLERERLEVRSWPNPARRTVSLNFELPQSGRLQLSVLDVGGGGYDL